MQETGNSSISIALKEYQELKKNNLSDRQIKKIAQILNAFAIDDKQWP